MESITIGQRVTVADVGPAVDGIVFDTPSRSKVVVAVRDPKRGPIFRTVHPKTLTDRETEGAHDAALRLLVRRTAPPVHAASGGAGLGRKGRPGFNRGTAHRPTGR